MRHCQHFCGGEGKPVGRDPDAGLLFLVPLRDGDSSAVPEGFEIFELVGPVASAGAGAASNPHRPPKNPPPGPLPPPPARPVQPNPPRR